MEFDLKKEGSALIVTFNNPRLDYYIIRDMEEQLINEFESCDKIVFDMKNVEFIASAFIRLCLEAIQKTGKNNFEMLNVDKFVKTVLQISKFDQFVKVK